MQCAFRSHAMNKFHFINLCMFIDHGCSSSFWAISFRAINIPIDVDQLNYAIMLLHSKCSQAKCLASRNVPKISVDSVDDATLYIHMCTHTNQLNTSACCFCQPFFISDICICIYIYYLSDMKCQIIHTG